MVLEHRKMLDLTENAEITEGNSWLKELAKDKAHTPKKLQ